MMKNLFPFIIIMFFINRSDALSASAQYQSVISTNGISINSSAMITAVGTDPNMPYRGNDAIPTNWAISNYIDSQVARLKSSISSLSRNSVSITTTGTGASTYNVSTGVFNVPQPVAIYVPVIHDSITRLLNTNYIISSLESFITYSVKIDVSVTLGATSSAGKVTPQYSLNGGTTWVSLPYVQNSPSLGNLGVLTLSLLQSNVYQFGGWVPAGATVRILSTTTGTIGNVTYTLYPGQERY